MFLDLTINDDPREAIARFLLDHPHPPADVDALEREMVAQTDDGASDGFICEPIFAGDPLPADLNRLIWSLYVHRPGQGVECIADCSDRTTLGQLYDAVSAAWGIT